MAFSEKQRQIMRFPYTGYDALICDGAVRSGKTSIMSLSFFLWAMGNFNNCAFAFCGKSVGAVERNIVTPLLSVVYLKQNFDIRYNRGDHVIVASEPTTFRKEDWELIPKNQCVMVGRDMVVRRAPVAVEF